MQTKPAPHRASSQGSARPSLPNSVPLDEASLVPLGQGLDGRYGLCPVASILENQNAVRTHSKRHIKKIGRVMQAAGPLAPLILDETYTLLAGHGRLAAAKDNGEGSVPVVQVFGLSHAQKRLYLLSDNEVGRGAGLDRAKLAQQLPELTILFEDAGFELTDTGFEVAELDQIVLDGADGDGDEEDALDVELFDEPTVLRAGDLLLLGEHRLIIGDARDDAVLDALMAAERAEAAFLDPPYNVSVKQIGGRGRIRHEDFAFASGEMTEAEFLVFLKDSLGEVSRKCAPGAVVFVCMDWKHVRELIEAGSAIFDEYLNLVVWNKTNAGQGGLYRNKHELIGVFRVGDEPHCNNVQLGRFGRNRSNVWTYAGVNTFRAGRLEELAQHPTVKPTQLVADALKDVTKRGGIVLDTFVGSGTTILAGEKVGRRVRAVEIEPRYAQIAARRWEKLTGRDAIHATTRQTLDQLAARISGEPSTSDAVITAAPARSPAPRVRVRSLAAPVKAVDNP